MYENSNFVQYSQCENDNSQTYPSHYNYIDTHGRMPFTFSTYDYNDQSKKDTNFIVALHQRQLNAEFFENFINENTNDTAKLDGNRQKHKRLGISDTKVLIGTIKKLNDDLKKLTLTLGNEKNQSQTTEWTEKMEKCVLIMNEIERLSGILRDADGILSFTKLIEKRKKKRQRLKRLRAKWQAHKLVNAEKRSSLNAAIDNWIREKQELIECEKQKECQRQNADLILSDIRGKRSDAKKYLTILDQLEKLRKVQVNNANARGESFSAADNQTFDSCIGRLIEQWSILDRQSANEEQELKSILKSDNEKILADQKSNSFDDWETVIFGCKLPSRVENNLSSFVMSRIAWDKYVNFEGDGSRIPIGWIMPEISSSAAWQKFLKKN